MAILILSYDKAHERILLMAALIISLGKQREAEENRTPVGRPGSLAAQGSIKLSAGTR
jgi:hypothetical protein